MLNLGNLLTSMMLATGVATTTPVNHAKNIPSKNENIINNYRIDLNESEETTTFTYLGNSEHNPQNENQYLNQTAALRLHKKNYSATSSYINVIGSKYTSQILTHYNSTDYELYQNINTLNGTTNYSEYATNTMLVLQIDSYNYNINTNIDLIVYVRMALNGTTVNGQTWFSPTNTLQRIVYQTTQDNWANYLNMQLGVNAMPYAIKNDIENVNNGFYYSKVVDAVESDNLYQAVDTISIGLEPNKTNYIAIMYTPTLNAKILVGSQYETDTTNKIIPQTTNDYEIEAPSIRGTNIIPDGTYEVIDIPGLMWQILTMPFAFVSQAFNLTLFPGTPYQLNISNLFLSIIAVITFIWLITFFMKMKG